MNLVERLKRVRTALYVPAINARALEKANGYRRVFYILRRDGWQVNMKKVYRLYRELGLQLRNKTPKRRVKAKLRADRTMAIRPNDVWAMDFVHDQLATGRKLRILTVVDT